MKYKLLIFDWDGTLMDSAEHITRCMHAAIHELDAQPKTSDEIRNIIGLGLEEAILGLYPHAQDSFVTELANAYRDNFLFKNNTTSPLFEGAMGVLDSLKSNGYDLAIATGKSRRGLDKVLLETGLEAYFPVTRCADETFSKPHPQMLEEILVDYNYEAADAIMIGDTEYDLLMAKNARMDGLAVSYGVHALERLLAHEPTGFVDDLRDIPKWLETNESN